MNKQKIFLLSGLLLIMQTAFSNEYLDDVGTLPKLLVQYDAAVGKVSVVQTDNQVTWPAVSLADVHYKDNSGNDTAETVAPEYGWSIAVRNADGLQIFTCSKPESGLSFDIH